MINYKLYFIELMKLIKEFTVYIIKLIIKYVSTLIFIM